MKVITEREALAWCQSTGAPLEITRSGMKPSAWYDSRGIRVMIEGSAVDVLGLAYVLLMTGVTNDDEAQFGGALVWLRDWDIWSTGIEHVGYLLLEGLRTVAFETSTVRDRPGHLFGSAELVAARATLGLPMLFQWDAVFVPSHGSFAVSISHHGHFDLLFPNAGSEQELISRFEAGGHRVERFGPANFST